MSLFGFGDIVFNKQGPNPGPLKALEGTEFATRTLRYPEDIGNYDKGHYMVFYVREQKNSAYAKNDNVNDSVINSNAVAGASQFQNVPLVGNAASNIGSALLGKLNTGLGKLNSATGGAVSGLTGAVSSAAGGIVGGINNIFGQKASIPSGNGAATGRILSENLAKINNNSFVKTTQLTKDAIALYMPDTLMYVSRQTYENASMGYELAGQALAAGRSALEQYNKNKTHEAALGSIAKSAALFAGSKIVDKLGTNTGAVLKGMFGVAQNPLIEMIYRAPNFRTFEFEFLFYPRNEREALEVQKIIERFRFHHAPEFVQEAKGFLIPPSAFDIRFYYGGSQNPNIPKIATCVLTSMDINYAPTGFSAYEIPGESEPSLGRTGMPVAIQMRLEFTELTYLTKEDITDFDTLYTKPPVPDVTIKG